MRTTGAGPADLNKKLTNISEKENNRGGRLGDGIELVCGTGCGRNKENQTPRARGGDVRVRPNAITGGGSEATAPTLAVSADEGTGIQNQRRLLGGGGGARCTYASGRN